MAFDAKKMFLGTDQRLCYLLFNSIIHVSRLAAGEISIFTSIALATKVKQEKGQRSGIDTIKHHT